MNKLLFATVAAGALVSTAAQSQTTYVPPNQRIELLRSLPTEAQKRIKDVRASCKETLEHSTTGEEGLIQFLLDGKRAVMLDGVALCGGSCAAGVNCSNRGTRTVEVYWLQGTVWTRVLLEESFTGDIFISYKPGRPHNPEANRELNALVADVYYRESNDCPTKRAPDASSQSWEARTCVVRWHGGKFIYKPL
jgi:hypothetical protein